MNPVLICILGISGVGKSTLTRRYASENPGWVALSASKLIAEDLLSDPELMRIASEKDIKENQKLIVSCFQARKLAAPTKNYLLAGHALIDNGESVVELTSDVFLELKPAGFVFLFDSPFVILERRAEDTVRVRPVRLIQELEAQQERTAELCESFSQELRIPLHSVRASQFKAFTAAVKEIAASGT